MFVAAHLDEPEPFLVMERLPGDSVRDRGLMGLEQAVHLLTDVPARLDRLPWSGFHRLVVVALGITTVGPVAAAKPLTAPRNAGQAWDPRPSSASDGVIVTYAPGTTNAQKAAAVRTLGLTRGRDLNGLDAGVYRRDPANLRRDPLRLPPGVVLVTPDMRLQRDADPTGEPGWSQLWGLNNVGQPVLSNPGTPNIDIDGLEAQAITTGDPATVVAVIDDGVDFSHPDLAARAWTNPGESGGGKETNGIDDDHNGYIDDIHGYDFANHDGDPMDDNFHGTHVAGIIGAVGDNGISAR